MCLCNAVVFLCALRLYRWPPPACQHVCCKRRPALSAPYLVWLPHAQGINLLDFFYLRDKVLRAKNPAPTPANTLLSPEEGGGNATVSFAGDTDLDGLAASLEAMKDEPVAYLGARHPCMICFWTCRLWAAAPGQGVQHSSTSAVCPGAHRKKCLASPAAACLLWLLSTCSAKFA